MIDIVSPELIAFATFRFRDGITENIRRWLIEAQLLISKEPGCLIYRFSVDLLVPDLIRITEHWTDQAALDAHINNANTAELVGNLVSAGMTDFVIQSHTILPRAEHARL